MSEIEFLSKKKENREDQKIIKEKEKNFKGFLSSKKSV